MKKIGVALITLFTILALCFAAGVVTTGRIVYVILACMAIALAMAIADDIKELSNNNEQ